MTANDEEETRSQTRQRLAAQKDAFSTDKNNMLLEKRNMIKKYSDYVIPAPGNGCHTAILGKANLGAAAGLSPERVFEDIRKSLPAGSRRVPDREIEVTVKKAYSDVGKDTAKVYSKAKTAVKDGKAALRRIIEQGRYRDEASIREASEIRIEWAREMEAAVFIESMFPAEAFLFIGDFYDLGVIGKNIRRADEWVHFFQDGGKAGPFIIINPLSGNTALKKSGDGETFRGDLNVKSYLHCLVEFDHLSHEDQFAFWSGFKLPVKALVDTGGKSIHAWLDVSKLASVQTPEEWDRDIKRRLYDENLIPMGVDGACKNPARLSRLPGCDRPDKGTIQRLIWFSREGREVAR